MPLVRSASSIHFRSSMKRYSSELTKEVQSRNMKNGDVFSGSLNDRAEIPSPKQRRCLYTRTPSAFGSRFADIETWLVSRHLLRFLAERSSCIHHETTTKWTKEERRASREKDNGWERGGVLRATPTINAATTTQSTEPAKYSFRFKSCVDICVSLLSVRAASRRSRVAA